jgi:spore germination protein
MKKLLVTLILLFTFISVVSAQSATYVVKRGDTLASIAGHYGTTVGAIVDANGIVNPNRIYAGMVLHIPTNYRVHHVQYGDTLSELAVYYHTTVAAIRNLNGLTPSTIYYPGDILLIPPPSYNYYQPQYHPQPYHPPTYTNTYVVKHGDTMLRIAAHYGVNVWDLARANSIYNLNRIYVGQVLHIPH